MKRLGAPPLFVLDDAKFGLGVLDFEYTFLCSHRNAKESGNISQSLFNRTSMLPMHDFSPI